MNNEEQMLLMLQGLTADVQELKGLKEDVRELKEDMHIIRTAISRIENEHGAKLQAVIDAQVAFEERFNSHEPRIVKLENKSDRYDVEIAHLLRKVK